MSIHPVTSELDIPEPHLVQSGQVYPHTFTDDDNDLRIVAICRALSDFDMVNVMRSFMLSNFVDDDLKTRDRRVTFADHVALIAYMKGEGLIATVPWRFFDQGGTRRFRYHKR